MGEEMQTEEWKQRYEVKWRSFNPYPGDNLADMMIATDVRMAAEDQTEQYGASGLAWESPELVAERDYQRLIEVGEE